MAGARVTPMLRNLDDPSPPAPARAMDKHYLTPLFSPASIRVFAGQPEQRARQTALARALLDGLRGEGSAPGHSG